MERLHRLMHNTPIAEANTTSGLVEVKQQIRSLMIYRHRLGTKAVRTTCCEAHKYTWGYQQALSSTTQLGADKGAETS
jgi:hypothetical protein